VDEHFLFAVDSNGNCQILAPATRGERVLMTYSVDLAKQGNFVAPVSATLVCECDADYNKKVNITVVVQNNVGKRGVQYVNIEVRGASWIGAMMKYTACIDCSRGCAAWAREADGGVAVNGTVTRRMTF
jgi:hypothetical protein